MYGTKKTNGSHQKFNDFDSDLAKDFEDDSEIEFLYDSESYDNEADYDSESDGNEAE